MKAPTKLFISAGEASGDVLGARLLNALGESTADEISAFGLGGPAMAAAGFERLRDASELSIVGLFEVIRHLPRLFALLDDVARRAIAGKPDVAVLIDVPDFNLRLARRLKRAGIPVVMYVAPQVWAWRPGRVHRFAPYVDRMLTLFPFEPPLWTAAGVDARVVGHPLLDEILEPAPPELSDAKTIALLPGSRRGELARHLVVLLDAARELARRGVAERFVLPVAPTLDRSLIEAAVVRRRSGVAIELVEDRAGGAVERRRAIAGAAAAIVASGTATLETALLGRPQVIVYRASWPTYWVAKRLARVERIGLPNIIAGRSIAPELLQGAFEPIAIARATERLLTDGPERAAQISALGEMRSALGPPGASKRAALAVLEIAERARS